MSIDISIKRKLKFITLDVSFSCDEGKMLVLIGPSGGGKTSIIRMLAGLDTPDNGEIIYNNSIWYNSSKKINMPPQKRKVGYVFQDYTLFPHLNLFENVAFAAENRKEVYDLLEFFNIQHLCRRKPRNVSGGERQRCAICQAIARHPQVLFLDEPFSALDAVTRRTLRKELKNLKTKYSFPIIFVTHDINEALYLADEIYPVVNGKKDETWFQNTIAPLSSNKQLPRAARETRLALVY